MEETESGEAIPFVFVIVGGVRREGESEMVDFHALLSAPDDDSAVRRCLEALASEGYEEANLDQIGTMIEPDDSDAFAEPYRTARSGEIALIIYDAND